MFCHAPRSSSKSTDAWEIADTRISIACDSSNAWGAKPSITATSVLALQNRLLLPLSNHAATDDHNIVTVHILYLSVWFFDCFRLYVSQRTCNQKPYLKNGLPLATSSVNENKTTSEEILTRPLVSRFWNQYNTPLAARVSHKWIPNYGHQLADRYYRAICSLKLKLKYIERTKNE